MRWQSLENTRGSDGSRERIGKEAYRVQTLKGGGATMVGIVYAATCKVSMQSYVGSSIRHLEVRKAQHVQQSRGHGPLGKFHMALRGHIDDFDWRVLEEVDTGDLVRAEQKWIDKLDSVANGFNSKGSFKREQRARTNEEILANFGSIRQAFKAGLTKPTEIEPRLLVDMFVTFAREQPEMEDRMANVRAEKLGHSGKKLVDIRLRLIGEITNMMGIQGSWEVGAQIERAVMEKSCQKVLEMRKDLQSVFDLRLRETKRRDTIKRGLELLNSVLRRWGFTEVVTEGPRKRTRVKGKLEDIRGFAVAESGEYKGFGRFT